MKKVSFNQMKEGTKEDYLLLDKHERDYAGKTAERILIKNKQISSKLF